MSKYFDNAFRIVLVDPCYFNRYFLGRQIELVSRFSVIKEFSSGAEALDYLSADQQALDRNLQADVIIINSSVIAREGARLFNALDSIIAEDAVLSQLKIFVYGAFETEAVRREIMSVKCVSGVLPVSPSADDINMVFEHR